MKILTYIVLVFRFLSYYYAAAIAVPPPTAITSHRRTTPEDMIDYITVSDPVIHADGMNKYTSYRVDCRPSAPPPSSDSLGGTPPAAVEQDVFLQHNINNYSSVLRRYTEFKWLYDTLHREKSGAIIPPLPDKQTVNRFTPEFVEERRIGLEKFIRRVVTHPELWDATCLGTFLRADDLQFNIAKNAGKAMDMAEMTGSVGGIGGDYGRSDSIGNSNNMIGVASGITGTSSLGGAGAFNLAPKNAAGIKKWFSEAKTTFSGDLVSSPDDDLFDEIGRYIDCLNIQMKRVSSQASALVRKSREIANGMFEFGLAFHQLGQSEGGALGTKLQLMGSTADTLSALAANQAEAELRKLEDPFRDYIKIIHGVRLALGRRHDKRVSYTALLHEIQTREVNLHRLRMTPGSEAKAYSTEISLQRYHAAANLAREEYAECSQRVLREVDRFKREKAEEMKVIVLQFIQLEIDVNRSMERIWGELVPQLEEEGGTSSSSSSSSSSSFPEEVKDGTSGGMVVAAWEQQQQQYQMKMPTQTGGLLPSTTTTTTAAPMYSNVPTPQPMSSSTQVNNPMMESSIQYRDTSGLGF
jgi:sorting nexin-1/2